MNNLIGSLDQCLPPAYDWLDSLKLNEFNGLSTKAWNVVPVEKDGDKLKFLADSIGGMEAALEEHIAAVSWQLGEGVLRATLDGTPFVLVAKPSVKTNARQVSRQLGFDLAAGLKKAGNKTVAIGALGADLLPLDVFEGFCLGLDDRAAFKSKKDSHFPEELFLSSELLSEGSNRIEMAKSLVFTKWLQDAPANFLHSEQFADIAQEFFGSKAKVTALGRKEMEEKGMGSFLAVARGALRDPKLVTIEIEGKDKTKSVALVGKGVTFDSGGINIKPSAGMEDMKYDMSGAAAVYGAAHYLAMSNRLAMLSARSVRWRICRQVTRHGRVMSFAL